MVQQRVFNKSVLRKYGKGVEKLLENDMGD